MPGSVFLENDTVSLRPAEDEDIPFLLENRHDPEVRASRSIQLPADAGWAQKRLGGTLGRHDDTVGLLVCVEETPVGYVYLIREDPDAQVFRLGELAYWITPEEWGNGYATAAGRLVVNYAFSELGLHRLEATAYASNAASQRVLEKLGFTQEGVARKRILVDSEWVDNIQYGLLSEEYEHGET